MEKFLTYLELAEMVLREAKKPLTPVEIWQKVCEKGWQNRSKSIGQTPEASLGARLYVDVRDNANSLFEKTNERPATFYLKENKNGQKEAEKNWEKEVEKNEEKITFIELALQVLKEASTPLTATEIWNTAKEKGLFEQLNTASKKPQATFRAVLVIENRKNNPRIIQISEDPITFWLKEREKELTQDKIKLEQQIQKEEEQKNRAQERALKFIERDLHPLLVYFLKNNENFGLESKTIFHENCIKYTKGKALWNYPDIVGVRFPNLADETTNLLSNINQGSYRFYSFELKISINFSNLKECYFQAVSNSSWANEGYLVVFKDIEEDVLKELKRLNQSFGIGVIQLEKSPLESEVILPARSRNLDIETLNMLVKDSPDFQNFVKEISGHIAAKNQKLGNLPIKSDKVLSDEQLEKHITDKKIDKI